MKKHRWLNREDEGGVDWNTSLCHGNPKYIYIYIFVILKKYIFQDDHKGFKAISWETTAVVTFPRIQPLAEPWHQLRTVADPFEVTGVDKFSCFAIAFLSSCRILV